jgi:2-keto-4-pentenoate hydratase
MHAGFVLPQGEARRFNAGDLEMALSIRLNDVEVVAGAVLEGGPVASLRWLAGRLGKHRLSRGQIILTGSPAKLFPVAAGSRIVVEASLLGRCCAEIVP